jgi:hypothetical protein
MRFVIATILMMALGFGAEYFLHIWWMVAVVCFAVAVTMKEPLGKAFLSGFVAVALLWAVVALRADSLNDHILATRMGKLFSLPNFGLFITVVAFIGGLVGGFSAWSGSMMAKYGRGETAK